MTRDRRMYCDICGEEFDYKLKRIPVEREPGQITYERACALCASQYTAEHKQVEQAMGINRSEYTHEELMQVLSRLADCGYVCGGGGVKELVEQGLVEFTDPGQTQERGEPTNKGLIELGNWILEKEDL